MRFPHSRWSPLLASILGAAASVLVLVSCGGGVSAPTSPIVDSPTISILPANAVMYSGLPSTFVLSGGTGSYIVTSSNQAVLAIAGGVTGRSVTLVAASVAADTEVTLTVRDTGTAAPVTAVVTVKPGTVSNTVTITPTSTITGCTAPALCSGGDAEVVATLSQNGNPLAGRGVRFEVVTGDYRYITSAANVIPEVLELGQTVVTDSAGKARARLRVLPSAPNQTAILKVVDLTGQAFQQASFPIAQVTAGGGSFYAIPSEATFTGPRADQCASGASARFFVFGGLPPYVVSNSNAAFGVAPTSFGAGGSFTVTALGSCADPGFPIGVTDASGRAISVTVTSKRGADAVPALVVAPATVTLSDCSTQTATVSVAGGSGSYLPASGSTALIVSGSGNIFSIYRRPGSPATAGPLTVGFSDGVSTVSVTVTLAGAGAGAC